MTEEEKQRIDEIMSEDTDQLMLDVSDNEWPLWNVFVSVVGVYFTFFEWKEVKRNYVIAFVAQHSAIVPVVLSVVFQPF